MASKLFPAQFERIKQVTGAKTDQELAVILGITSSGITNAKARDSVPRKWLFKVAGVYGVDINWLTHGESSIEDEQPAQNKPSVVDELGKRISELERKIIALEARLEEKQTMIDRLLELHKGGVEGANADTSAPGAHFSGRSSRD